MGFWFNFTYLVFNFTVVNTVIEKPFDTPGVWIHIGMQDEKLRPDEKSLRAFRFRPRALPSAVESHTLPTGAA